MVDTSQAPTAPHRPSGARPGSRAMATEGCSHAILSLPGCARHRIQGCQASNMRRRRQLGAVSLPTLFILRVLLFWTFSTYRHILFLLSRDVFLTLRARLRSMFLFLVANNTTRRYSDVRSSTIRDPLFKHNRIYRSDPVVGTTESLGLC